MANFNKFKVTWEGSGSIFVGGQLRSSGDEFTLTSDQVDRYIKTSDFEDGFIIPLDENSSAYSDDIQRQLDGKSKAFSKNNFAAPDVLNLVTTTTAGAGAGGVGYVGNEISGGVDLGRRGAVAKILSRTPARAVFAATYEPRLLVSAGEETRVAPTIVKKYVALTGAYSDLTNGSIVAANLAAANDMLVVGYTEKFASVAFQVGTANNAAQLFDNVYYWNGSAWTAFDSVSDFTTVTYDGTSSLGKTGSVSRVAWFTEPTDWVLGGPTGSGCGELNYCVALRIDGAFANLASCGVYPVMDTPIADIMLGTNIGTFDAVVTSMGAGPVVYTDETSHAASATTDDVGAQLGIQGAGATHGTMILGYSTPFQAFAVTIGSGGPNIVDEKMVINYWNGVAWSADAKNAAAVWAGVVTDDTYASGTLINSGIVSITALPSDWRPAVMTDLTGFTATGLTTVTTDTLYWIRLSTANQLTAGTNISQITVAAPSKTWLETAPVGSSFIEAGEQLRVSVMDSETTATVEMKAVLMDV